MPKLQRKWHQEAQGALRAGRPSGRAPPTVTDTVENGAMSQMPAFIAPTRFTDAAAALAQVQTIYRNSTEHLRDALQRFVAGEDMGRVRAFYPFVRVATSTVARNRAFSSLSAACSANFTRPSATSFSSWATRLPRVK